MAEGLRRSETDHAIARDCADRVYAIDAGHGSHARAHGTPQYWPTASGTDEMPNFVGRHAQAIGVETGGAELHARVNYRTGRQGVGDRAIEVVVAQASPATGSNGSRVGVVIVDYPR